MKKETLWQSILQPWWIKVRINAVTKTQQCIIKFRLRMHSSLSIDKVTCMHGISTSNGFIIPLLQLSWRGGGGGGVYWFHLVRLSVCGQSRVRSVSSTILIGSISYLHILSSIFRRCDAWNGCFKIKKLWRIFLICNFEFIFFWLGIQYDSMVWVIMRWRGVSSELRRSSCSSSTEIYKGKTKTCVLYSNVWRLLLRYKHNDCTRVPKKKVTEWLSYWTRLNMTRGSKNHIRMPRVYHSGELREWWVKYDSMLGEIYRLWKKRCAVQNS